MIAVNVIEATAVERYGNVLIGTAERVITVMHPYGVEMIYERLQLAYKIN